MSQEVHNDLNAISVNPLLAKARIPGETHRLPSCGLFYKNDELSANVKNGELHIYPMTTIDEITMRSPDKLFSGEAIDEIFKRCIPDILKPKELLQKDVDFLMACLRKISYGNDYEMIFTHNCEKAKEHSYILPMDKYIKAAKSINPTSLNKVFTIKLPNEQIVKLNPIKYCDVLEMVHITDKDLTDEQKKDITIKSLLGIISVVDGIEDKNMISEWLNTIPVGWAKQISDAIDQISDWGPDFMASFECKDCKKEIELSAPINPISFFI